MNILHLYPILVAEGMSAEMLQDELEYLSQMAPVYIKGKVTSKKISTWLKAGDMLATLSPTKDILDQILQPEVAILRHFAQDEDGYLSDLSTISNEEEIQDGMLHGYATEDIMGVGGRHRLRRAVSLEDLAVPSPIDLRPHNHHHLLVHNHHSQTQKGLEEDDDDDDLIERPTSSMSISLPVSTDHCRVHHHHHPLHNYPDQLHQRHHHHQAAQYSPLLDQFQGLYPFDTQTSSNINSNSKRNTSKTNTGIMTSRTLWPDTSPEEISASSDELLRETLLEDSKSTRSVYTFQSAPEQPIHSSGFFGGLVKGRGGGGPVRSSEETQCGQTLSGAWGWVMGSPLLDAVISWIEGPGVPIPQKKSEKDKPNPLLDIPLQFIALLTYPEPDPKAGNALPLALVRETSFVRQRRRTLLILTAYTLVVRYCSFDFFLVVLFASNCAMLFLMKNSGRMNVNMAKRAVNQRVGWAKQWAGGFFRRGGGNVNNNNNNNSDANNGLSLHGNSTSGNGKYGSISPSLDGAQSNVSYSKSAPSLMASTANGGSTRTGQTSNMDDSATITMENSPRIKRRGFFGKRSTTASSPPRAPSTLALSIHGGEGGNATVDEPTTQKRRFFKRSTTSNNTNNTSTTLNIPLTISSIPSRSSTAPPTHSSPTKSIGALPDMVLPPSSSSSSSSTSRPSNNRANSNGNGHGHEQAMLNQSPTHSSSQWIGIIPSSRSPSPSLTRKTNNTIISSSPKSLAPEFTNTATTTTPTSTAAATTSMTASTVQQTMSPPVSAPAALCLPNPAFAVSIPGAVATTSATTTTTTPSSSTAIAQGRSLSKSILASLTPSRVSSSLLSSQHQQQQQQQQQDSAKNQSQVVVVSPTASRPAVALVAAEALSDLSSVSAAAAVGRVVQKDEIAFLEMITQDDDDDDDDDQGGMVYNSGQYAMSSRRPSLDSQQQHQHHDVYHLRLKTGGQHLHLDMLDAVSSAAANEMEGV
ncbi:hypothetical protein BG004_002809 [Podila humilis]|nr:hypothetical protein BG004_002809 [Podila humilis]